MYKSDPADADRDLPPPLAVSVTGDHLLRHTELHIELDPQRVRIRTVLRLDRHPDATAGAPVVLDVHALEIHDVHVDGRSVSSVHADGRLELDVGPDAPATTTVTIESSCVPGGIADEGFSVRGRMISTACEPESYRRICPSIDRPSQRSTYDVTLIADPGRYPLLRANGTLVDEGTLPAPDARRWRRFVDPVPKPTYLFAVVAGHLDERSVELDDGLRVTLVAEHERIGGGEFALTVLPQVIEWDLAHGGVPHDLPELALAAIPSYPGDACECHGLMLFETNTLLLDPTGHTDDDLVPVLANVAHEYLHHTRGNRVTVATWHDLVLKEGLTVLAQNDVRTHLHGPAARIQDVHDLRRLQHPEEVVHPVPVVQPNGRRAASLYTRTTYLKGAEVMRMLRLVAGDSAWQAAMARWVETFDLSASTLEQFLDLVRDESTPERRSDLDAIGRWFHLVGRPAVRVRTEVDGDAATLTFERTDGLGDDPPVGIPIAVSAHGDARRLALAAAEPIDDSTGGVRDASVHPHDGGVLVVLRGRSATVKVATARPPTCITVLDGHSAPIDLHLDIDDEGLARIVRCGGDPVARWLAAETLATRLVDAARRDEPPASLVEHLTDATRAAIDVASTDPALAAHLLATPDEHALGDREPMIDVGGVHHGLDVLRRTVGAALGRELLALVRAIDVDDLSVEPVSIARRALVDACLGPLLAAGHPDALDLVRAQVASPNATVAVRALAQLLHVEAPGIDGLVEECRVRWRDAPALTDRWVRAQSGSRGAGTLDRVRRLVLDPRYRRDRRPSVMAVWFPFCTRNRGAFHRLDGTGYRVFADEAMELLAVNPAPVLRLVGDLLQFERFAEPRASAMRAELQRIGASAGLPAFVRARIETLVAGT